MWTIVLWQPTHRVHLSPTRFLTSRAGVKVTNKVFERNGIVKLVARGGSRRASRFPYPCSDEAPDIHTGSHGRHAQYVLTLCAPWRQPEDLPKQSENTWVSCLRDFTLELRKQNNEMLPILLNLLAVHQAHNQTTYSRNQRSLTKRDVMIWTWIMSYAVQEKKRLIVHSRTPWTTSLALQTFVYSDHTQDAIRQELLTSWVKRGDKEARADCRSWHKHQKNAVAKLRSTNKDNTSCTPRSTLLPSIRDVAHKYTQTKRDVLPSRPS